LEGGTLPALGGAVNFQFSSKVQVLLMANGKYRRRFTLPVHSILVLGICSLFTIPRGHLAAAAE
jgi:hypothetical protein